MMMPRLGKVLTATTIIHACLIGAAFGQVIERDTTITGPRGNSIERQVTTERMGNVIDRSVSITRPGGTISRQTQFIAPGGFRGGPAFIGGPRLGIVPFIAAPIVAPGVSLFFGGGGPGGPGGPGRPPGMPHQPDVIDGELANLTSIHSDHRRDACITLGKYANPRALPAMVDRLKHDHEKEVRQAAAWALGEMGDLAGIVPLEMAAQSDKKADVRAVANKAVNRLHERQAEIRAAAAVAQAQAQAQAHAQPVVRHAQPTFATRPASSAVSPPPPPVPSTDDVPPPDPTPAAASPTLRAPNPDPGFGYPSPSR